MGHDHHLSRSRRPARGTSLASTTAPRKSSPRPSQKQHKPRKRGTTSAALALWACPRRRSKRAFFPHPSASPRRSCPCHAATSRTKRTTPRAPTVVVVPGERNGLLSPRTRATKALLRPRRRRLRWGHTERRLFSRLLLGVCRLSWRTRGGFRAPCRGLLFPQPRRTDHGSLCSRNSSSSICPLPRRQHAHHTPPPHPLAASPRWHHTHTTTPPPSHKYHHRNIHDRSHSQRREDTPTAAPQVPPDHHRPPQRLLRPRGCV